MSDSDILVTTRYTTEGYDAALSKADRIGQTMLKLSRDIGGIGRFFNSEFLQGVGNALGGIEDMIGAVSELSKAIKKVPALGSLLAGAGGAFIGSKIYDAAIGQLQGTSTDKILGQLKTLIDYGFDTSRIQKDLQIKAELTRVDAANAIFNIKEAAQKNDPAVNQALSKIFGVFGSLPGIGDKYSQLAQAYSDVSGQQKQKIDDQKRMSDLLSSVQSKMRAAADIQDRLSSASKTYHAAEMDRAKELAQVNAEVYQRRIAAAQSLTADLAKMDSAYYANRLKMAESFGLEAKRAEEDHQREMQRLAQDHDKRMSKLADSRDALGIEDEIQNYEDQRKAAEEDFAVMQARRNEDFAIQLRDMETAYRQQRQERINQYNEQLRDISIYLTEQRKLVNQQFADIAKAVIDAFTNAARAYTSVTNSQTSNNTKTLNQTNNFGSVSDPNAVVNMVNNQIKAIFNAATT